MVPYAGRELELFFTAPSTSKHGGTVDIAKTDSSGKFILSYEYVKGIWGVRGTTIFLYDANFPQKLLEGVPINENLEFDIVVYEKATLEINLTTNTPYTENDTLYYSVQYQGDNYPKMITGPFTDHVIDTVKLDVHLYGGTSYNFRYFGGMKGKIYWGLGLNDNNEIEFTLTGCGVVDEVTINLD